MEVFFCTCPITEERKSIAQSCLAIWKVMDVELTVLSPYSLFCSKSDFQRQRRIVADELAKRDVYILADDDCIPHNIDKGIRALRSHPDFGILSLWPENANIVRWTPEGYEIQEDLEVMEHYSVGGIRICRKGAMLKGWPQQSGLGYDAEHCDALRASGWRVGYSQHSRMFHLGEGKSEVWSQSSSQVAVPL